MRDESINLINKSWLMHWVANYEKSIELIGETEEVLKEKGHELAIIPKPEMTEWSQSTIGEVLNEGSYIVEQKEKKKKNERKRIRTREQLIISQGKKIYDLSIKQVKKMALKKLDLENKNLEPILTDYSDRFSCLSIKSDILTYEVRLVVNIDFSWTKVLEGEFEIDSTNIVFLSGNSHEIVLYVDSVFISGEVHFSSLGFAEGIFYEQHGFRAPDRSYLATTIMKNLAGYIYL